MKKEGWKVKGRKIGGGGGGGRGGGGSAYSIF